MKLNVQHVEHQPDVRLLHYPLSNQVAHVNEAQRRHRGLRDVTEVPETSQRSQRRHRGPRDIREVPDRVCTIYDT